MAWMLMTSFLSSMRTGKIALDRDKRVGGGAPSAPAQRSDGGRRFAVIDWDLGAPLGLAPELGISRHPALHEAASVPISGFRNGGLKGRDWLVFHDKALRVPLEKEDA